MSWTKFLSSPTKVLSAFASEFIWYNEYIKIGNNTIYYRYFSQKNINHFSDHSGNNSRIRTWGDLTAKIDLNDIKKFYWLQLIHAIPSSLKEMLLECGNNIINLIINEHHLFKKHQTSCLENPNIRRACNIQLVLKVEKPTAQTCF